MAFFSSWFGGSSNSAASDSGDASYANNALYGTQEDLTYEECRDIYRYFPLGKRIANALPTFALSAPRKFVVKDAPECVNNQIFGTAAELNLDIAVKRIAVYARIYGQSSVFITLNDDDLAPDKPINYKDIQKYDLRINVLDPLSAGANVSYDLNPLSNTFGQPLSIQIQGKQVHSTRLKIFQNDVPLYLKFNPSSFSFSGPSIYQNMVGVIKAWNRAIISMRRIATKAASIIKTTKDSANVTGLSLYATERNLDMIRNMENDGIAAIKSGETLEMFQLNGLQEIDAIINQLHTALMMALSDTPAGILLDKNLSSGLADGSEDMKAILMAVDSFRLSMLKPIYEFLDKFLIYKAFNAEFITETKKEYPDLYRDMSESEILELWVQNYRYEWGELYPQTENEKADSASKFLDNLTKIKELGANLSGIEEELNAYPHFTTDFDLEEKNMENEQGDLMGEGNDENKNDISPNEKGNDENSDKNSSNEKGNDENSDKNSSKKEESNASD